MRDASLVAFEFLFKTRVSEGVGRVFPEDRKDRIGREASSSTSTKELDLTILMSPLLEGEKC